MTEEFQILNFPLDPIVTLLSPFCHPFVTLLLPIVTLISPFITLLWILQELTYCHFYNYWLLADPTAYSTCNLMCQSDVFNILATLMPAAQLA